MKRFTLISILCTAAALAQIGAGAMALTACSTPSTRVVQVQTLKAVGQSAEAAMNLSIQLYKTGKITAAQAREINTFFDDRFQPAYRLAVVAVQSDLSQPASPQVADLAVQLVTLVNSYAK